MEKTTALIIALSVLLTATTAVSSARGMDEVRSFTVGEDTYYVTQTGQVFEETNECAGLQDGPGVVPGCDRDGDGQSDNPQPDKQLTPF